MLAGWDAAPAGGARNPAPGRPREPIGRYYGRSAGSLLDWDWAEMPRPRKRGPGEQKSPPWSAERRPRSSKESAARRKTVRLAALHPLGLSEGGTGKGRRRTRRRQRIRARKRALWRLRAAGALAWNLSFGWVMPLRRGRGIQGKHRWAP